MKYEIITASNEAVLEKIVNQRILDEKIVKILDAPVAVWDPQDETFLWTQAILIGDNTQRRSNSDISERRSGRQDS